MEPIGSLPDFGAPFGEGTVHGFAPFGDGPCTVLPVGVALAVANGRPVFALNMVRGPTRTDPAGNYAALEVQLTDDVPLDDALTQARATRPDATVVPAAFDLGFARLVPGGGSVALPADMTTPVPCGASPTGGPRWAQRMDLETGELIKGALLGGTGVFSARLEYTVLGVAPRVPVRADFVPFDLLDALVADCPGRAIAVPDLQKRLLTPPGRLTLTGSAPTDILAQVLTDRLCSAFGAFVPAARPVDPPCFSFAAQASTDAVSWDLNTVAVVSRAFLLQADLLTALKAVQDPASLVHEIAVPPLDLGFREIVVSANLPANRVGVPVIGARIDMPPAPPDRPQAINKSAPLAPPTDQTRVPLQIGVDEAFDYTVTAFAIVSAGGAVHQLQGTPRDANGAWLHLEADDLPIGFAHLTASDRLLRLATVTGVLSYTLDGKPVTQPITLKSGAADIAMPVPAAAEAANIVLTATAADGTKVSIGPMPPGVIRLDLPSFPGYGPHRVAISCTFAGNEPPLVIELATEDNQRQGLVTLLPASPSDSWGYVCGSPFRTGYRYRKQGGVWSAILAPNQPLMLKPDGSHAG